MRCALLLATLFASSCGAFHGVTVTATDANGNTASVSARKGENDRCLELGAAVGSPAGSIGVECEIDTLGAR